MNPNRPNRTDLEWLILKLSFVLVTAPVTCIMILSRSECPFPTGLCRLYDFAPLFGQVGGYITVAVFVGLCLLYIAERQMLVTTFLLALLSCIIISHHESNGVHMRATVLSVVWIAQFLAYFFHYLRPEFDLHRYRIQYGVQAMAAVYTLAGIAKLKASGMGWIDAGDTFPLQVVKNYSYLYYDTGSRAILQEGQSIAYFLLHHHLLVRLFLAISLVLEVACLVAAINRRVGTVWGLGLLLMHIGIATIMGIGISIIAKPMIVFFINPIYWIIRAVNYLRQIKA